MRTVRLFVLYLFICNNLFSQKSEFKYEAIKPADFTVTNSIIDTGSHAVILFDLGSSEFKVDDYGSFSLIFKKHTRVLIKNSTAYDAGKITIALYNGNNYINGEKLQNLEASTFNLINGKVVETKLDTTSIYTEKYNRQMRYNKFAMPNLKEGCIIEYKCEISSPFYNHLRHWSFQSEYPCLWSQYQVTIPPMFGYYTIKKGSLKYTIDSGFQKKVILSSSEMYNSNIKYSIAGDTHFAIWAIKDVPAFQNEEFISSPNNYINSIHFQLQTVNYKSYARDILMSWKNTAKDLLDEEFFGHELLKPNNWLSEIIKQIPHENNELETARNAYEFVRDHITCTSHDDMWSYQEMKDIYKSKSGNVADINLLLIALLRKLGFQSDPVILSTRLNGTVIKDYALLMQYNYVLARVKINDKYYLLDASDPHLGFAKLNSYCYNNNARIINEKAGFIDLSPDSTKEVRSTFVLFSNSENGNMNGNVRDNPGYYESKKIRDNINIPKDLEDFKKKIKNDYPTDINVGEIIIDSLKNQNIPLSVHYDLKLNLDGKSNIYFKPVIAAIVSNPFTATSRLYPIEMPYLKNEIYTLTMEIPKGYIVEDMPKSARINLNGNEGSYEYLIQKEDDQIQLRSVLKLEKPNYSINDYQNIRDFYGYIIKKQQEMIVFKKVK